MMYDEPVDLEPLGDYLDSSRAPEACMDLSELDGFLAGLVVGPDPVLPDEWLPMVWDEEDPEFRDDAEADLVLGTMFARYNEIADGLEGEDPTYDPVYWRDATGRTVVEDWTAGFMRAVGLRREAWEGVLENTDGARLFIPIVAVASLISPDIDPEDIGVSESDMETLVENAETVLAACVIGLNAFWRGRSDTTRPRLTIPASRARKPH
jgi:uncharacterized protein